MLRYSSHGGQTIVETIVILPFFLLFVFGFIQIGEIGVALVTASYAAGSIARHVVEEDPSNQPNTSDGNTRLTALLYAGMKSSGVQESIVSEGPLRNVVVSACIRISPLPFVGPFMNAALHDGYSGGGTADDCSAPIDTKTPLYFVPSGQGGHYYFVTRGLSSARMNYKPS